MRISISGLKEKFLKLIIILMIIRKQKFLKVFRKDIFYINLRQECCLIIFPKFLIVLFSYHSQDRFDIL